MGIEVKRVQRELCKGPIHQGVVALWYEPSAQTSFIAPDRGGNSHHSQAHLLSSLASTSLCESFSCAADLSNISELLIRISRATVYSHLGQPLAEHPALAESTVGLPAAFQSNNSHKLQQIPEVQKENKIPYMTNRKKKTFRSPSLFLPPLFSSPNIIMKKKYEQISSHSVSSKQGQETNYGMADHSQTAHACCLFSLYCVAHTCCSLPGRSCC